MKFDKTTDKATGSRVSRSGGPHISLDRRLHPRLPAVDYRIWVGYWSSETQFETVAARVENLSRGGALIASPNAPVPSSDVWLKLGSPAYNGCIRAEVLDVSERRPGEFGVRLQFDELCPEPFFDIVTEGMLQEP